MLPRHQSRRFNEANWGSDGKKSRLWPQSKSKDYARVTGILDVFHISLVSIFGHPDWTVEKERNTLRVKYVGVQRRALDNSSGASFRKGKNGGK